ncbi:hypothetical protein Hdeb2414_s0001g00029251 [Helianthus debilis subsp. tardiflorus]
MKQYRISGELCREKRSEETPDASPNCDFVLLGFEIEFEDVIVCVLEQRRDRRGVLGGTKHRRRRCYCDRWRLGEVEHGDEVETGSVVEGEAK